ncbi:hypothetical protein ZWY2020_006911 [Hordeum vulgare]|nr:hypothetical protein ZWY2020_006911 [Hordeum vulgare]
MLDSQAPWLAEGSIQIRCSAGEADAGRQGERDDDGWGLRRRWLGLRWRQDRPAAAYHGGACGTVLGQRSKGGGSRRLARAEAREAPGGGEVQVRWSCSVRPAVRR